jgi:hypothetical protein
MAMSRSWGCPRLWAVASVLLLILAQSSTSQAGIVLNGGSLDRNGDLLYVYIATASLTDGTSFEQGDSFKQAPQEEAPISRLAPRLTP